MKQVVFLVSNLLTGFFVFSQNQNSDSCIFFELTMKISNSSVRIQPFVRLNKCDEDFEVYKFNRFDQEFVAETDGKIFIEKMMSGFFFNINLFKSPGMFYDDSLYVKRRLKVGINKLEEFKLTDIMPLEKGKYRIRLRLDYFYNGQKRVLESKDLEFDLKKNYNW